MDLAGGDARRLLNYLEVVADFVESSSQPITPELITAAIGEKATAFDHQGDHYYDILSAFHKSVRGSSPDGALYWYARLLTGGGDALVIARRLLAIASEDIGNADPRALQLALNAWDTYHRVGPAEGERAIAQAVIYCACAAKSNAVYNAFKGALRAAKSTAMRRYRNTYAMHPLKCIKSRATVLITNMRTTTQMLMCPVNVICRQNWLKRNFISPSRAA